MIYALWAGSVASAMGIGILCADLPWRRGLCVALLVGIACAFSTAIALHQ